MTSKPIVIIAKDDDDEYEALKEYAALMARLGFRVAVFPESLSHVAVRWCRKCGLSLPSRMQFM